VECESPRAKLCQAIADSFRMPNGRILIVVKDRRVLRVEPTPILNMNEPDVLESVQCGPAPADS